MGTPNGTDPGASPWDTLSDTLRLKRVSIRAEDAWPSAIKQRPHRPRQKRGRPRVPALHRQTRGAQSLDKIVIAQDTAGIAGRKVSVRPDGPTEDDLRIPLAL